MEITFRSSIRPIWNYYIFSIENNVLNFRSTTLYLDIDSVCIHRFGLLKMLKKCNDSYNKNKNENDYIIQFFVFLAFYDLWVRHLWNYGCWGGNRRSGTLWNRFHLVNIFLSWFLIMILVLNLILILVLVLYSDPCSGALFWSLFLSLFWFLFLSLFWFLFRSWFWSRFWL